MSADGHFLLGDASMNAAISQKLIFAHMGFLLGGASDSAGTLRIS